MAARHLRATVIDTARRETGRLVTEEDTAFFGAMRAVMSDMEYVAALYCGWDGKDTRKIATAGKSAAFMREVVASATRNDGYKRWAQHLYELYRCGLIHRRAPKVVSSDRSSTRILSWALMYGRTASLGADLDEAPVEHLTLHRASAELAVLPVSVLAMYEDFLLACEWFADALEVEDAAGGEERLTRWQESWNGIIDIESTKLIW
jgi:hypothetical protein